MNNDPLLKRRALARWVAAILGLGICFVGYEICSLQRRLSAIGQRLATVEQQVSDAEFLSSETAQIEGLRAHSALVRRNLNENAVPAGAAISTNLVAYFNGLDTYAISGLITQPAPAITIDLRFWYVPKEDACVFVGTLDDHVRGGWAVFYDPEPPHISQFGIAGINAGWSCLAAGVWNDDQAVLTNAPPYNDQLNPHVLTISADVSKSNELVFLDGRFIFTLPGSAFTNQPDHEPMPLSKLVSAVTIGAVRQSGCVAKFSPGYVSDLRISDIQRHRTVDDYTEAYPWVDDEHVLHHWSAAASNPKSNVLVDVIASNNAVFFGPGPYFAVPPVGVRAPSKPLPKEPSASFRNTALLERFKNTWLSDTNRALELVNELDERQRNFYYEELRKKSIIEWLTFNSNSIINAHVSLRPTSTPPRSTADAWMDEAGHWKVDGFYGVTIVLTSTNEAPYSLVIPADEIRGLW